MSVHRGLGAQSETELVGFADHRFARAVPPSVGDVLAPAPYPLYLSDTLAGHLFPRFVPDGGGRGGLESSIARNGDLNDHARLLFRSFLAGCNERHAVDIIESVKARP